MIHARFESRNLVGDGLEISAALRKWYQEHPDAEIALLTDNNSVAELYRGMGVPLMVRYGLCPPEGYDFIFNFDVNKAFQICDEYKCPLAEGYARLLGVTLDTQQGKNLEALGPFYEPPTELAEGEQSWLDQVPDGTILIAPFSRSCSSHSGQPPNKCLPWLKWKPALRFLRSLKAPIRVTGSARERADELGFSEEEYICGMPLSTLARAMKQKIQLVVSVDNGISHLAGSQKVPQILYYPACLGLHYAVPWGNPMVIPVQLDPATVEPVQVGFVTRRAYETIQALKAEGPNGILHHRPGV